MSKSVKLILDGLNPLLIVMGLAVVSCTPGPPGVAAAIAAIPYDIGHKRWHGVLLSCASMIPLVGYIPAALKVGVLVVELKGRLDSLVVIAPDIHQSPEALRLVRLALGKYYRRLPNNRFFRRVREQLEEIMDLDDSGKERRPSTMTSGDAVV
jgi:hypothetical protein